MTAPPVASVVITNYNYASYIGAAIDSVLDQTVRCQVIVVDDGSSDDSLAVIEARRERYPEQVRVVAKTNGGQASAFNAGWAEVEAPLVLFLDGDDMFDPDAVERVVARLADEPRAVRCQFRLRWIDSEGHLTTGGFPEPQRRLPTGDLRQQMTRNPDDIAWQPTSGNAFRTEMLQRLLPMPEEAYRISADHYLSNLSALYGTIAAIEADLGSYRIHQKNNDHRSDFDLGRARDILIRTEQTHGHLRRQGVELGLAMPQAADGFLSVSNTGLRLVSYRLGDSAGSHHPFAADRFSTLVRRGLSSAWHRSDFSVTQRAMAVAWFVAVAVAPRALVPTIAAKALTR